MKNRFYPHFCIQTYLFISNQKNSVCYFKIMFVFLYLNFESKFSFSNSRPMANPVQSLNPWTWVRFVPSKFPRRVAGTFRRPSRSSRPTKPSSSKQRTDPMLRSGSNVCQWQELTMR